ncbi:MAG: peptidoglycan-binding protein [Candidatus Paceibacterota bacterium]
MIKKIALTGLGLALLAFPLFASADAASDLQAKIDGLLGQIRQLQEQLKQFQSPDNSMIACAMDAKICPDGTSIVRSGPKCEFAACPGETTIQPVPPIKIPPNYCPALERALNRGVSGDDVAQLQKFLATQGLLPEDSTTGFFGSATEAAVQKLQAANGIVASGDRATTGWGAVGPATRAWIVRWCGGGGNNNQNFSASPTSGQSPLAVNFGVTGAPATDFSSKDYTIDFGDGTSGQFTIIGQRECFAAPCDSNMYGASHTYTSNGTYVAKLTYQPTFNCPSGAMCPQAMPMPRTVGTVKIAVGGCDKLGLALGTCRTGTPSITGLDAPTSLAVGQTGNWTVHASVANQWNTQLSYSVVWGDEPELDRLQAYVGLVTPAVHTSGSFTHVYASAGTYKPIFTVANDIGSAQTSATVTVGDTLACTAMYRICPAGTHNGGRCNQDCIPDNTSSLVFSGSLTPGIAPGYATFRISNGTNANSSYSITFGDGTSGPVSPNCIATTNSISDTHDTISGCFNNGQYFAQHTYASSGTYTAKLYDNRADCAVGRDCSLGTVTITVGGLIGDPHDSKCPVGTSWQQSCSVSSCVRKEGMTTNYCPDTQSCTWGCYPLQTSPTPNWPTGSNAGLQAVRAALAIENQYLAIANQMASQKCVAANFGDIMTASPNVVGAQQALQVLIRLQNDLTVDSSATNQTIALQQLDKLIASRQIHTQNDVMTAQQSLQRCAGVTPDGGALSSVANALTALRAFLDKLSQ